MKSFIVSNSVRSNFKETSSKTCTNVLLGYKSPTQNGLSMQSEALNGKIFTNVPELPSDIPSKYLFACTQLLFVTAIKKNAYDQEIQLGILLCILHLKIIVQDTP